MSDNDLRVNFEIENLDELKKLIDLAICQANQLQGTMDKINSFKVRAVAVKIADALDVSLDEFR